MSYVKVHAATLRSDVSLKFDVFLKLADKHLLYCRKNDALEDDRFKKLKGKNVKYLFIKAEDEAAYQSFVKEALEKLKSNSMPVEKKSEALVGESKAAAQAVFENPEKKENYTHTQDIVTIQVDHLMKNPQAFEQMMKLENFDKSVHQHCVNVATISIGLTAFLGAPENICQVVGTGALLHDIGDKRTGADLLLPEDMLSEEDKTKYRNHPREGAALLADKKYISKDVLDIILLHHERLDGSGFPGGVKKLDQIFQVVGLANMYDKMVTFEGKQPKEAYEYIKNLKPAPYEEDLIVGLLDVLKSNKMIY